MSENGKQAGKFEDDAEFEDDADSGCKMEDKYWLGNRILATIKEFKRLFFNK